jgi:hypothetical protein
LSLSALWKAAIDPSPSIAMTGGPIPSAYVKSNQKQRVSWVLKGRTICSLTPQQTSSGLESISLTNLRGITEMSDEQLQRITSDQVAETDTTLTRGKFGVSGIANAIKSGELSPEDAIKLAEADWASKQGRKFTLPSAESREVAYEKSCAERAMFNRTKIPFIFPNFTPEDDFYLSQGLTLVGAMSGKGKSTAAANLLAGFINHVPEGTALVISNEEATDAIIHRTACVLLKKPYMKFHTGAMFRHEQKEVRELARTLLSRLIVVNDSQWNTACLEDVQTILEGSAAQGVSLILIDYLQTVNQSRDFPDMEAFKVLKKFGVFIREYGRRAPVPVVVFAQLNPKSESSEFQARVQNDKTIFNDAFNVVEIAPNQETKLTDFTIHKQRFGASQGVKVSLSFNSGRYEQVGGL